MSSFHELGVPTRLVDLLDHLAIRTPTPIQRATLPDALGGRDVLGRGRTGSGKTLAFLLPIVTRLSRGGHAHSGAPRALILAPTRELVTQIDTVLAPLAASVGLSSRTVFGGVGQGPQVGAIKAGVDILVACPGRLEDLIEQGHCSLAKIEITVLDEADHMSDLGFLPAVRRLLSRTPADSQRLMFSATLDNAVDALVQRFLSDPAMHEADSAPSPVAVMSHHVLQVERDMRLPVLIDLTSSPGKTVVFTRTKRAAKALARQLTANGVPAVELHGNLAQNSRTRNLDDFRAGRVAALVATDIAARGIHIDDVALVIHADPPTDPKAYLHRSGRTARAGNSGTVVTLTTAAQSREVGDLTRAAGIVPTRTSVDSPDHPVLAVLAPGARRLQKASGAGRPSPGGRANSTSPAPARERRVRHGQTTPNRARDPRPSRALAAPAGQRTPTSTGHASRSHSAATFSARQH